MRHAPWFIALAVVALGVACSESKPDELPARDGGVKTGCLDGTTGAQGACEDAGVDADSGM